jgi:hypothetical protein
MTTGISLPFRVIVSNTHTNNTASLNIQIELVPVREQHYPLEDVRIKLTFPQHYTNSNLSVTNGDFEFNNKTKVAIWNINKLEKDSNTALKGNLNAENTAEAIILSLSARIDKYSVTGGSVTKVVISKNPKNLNIYKGGKNTTYIRNLEIII